MDGLNILTISGWTQPADALANIAPNATHLDYAKHPDIDTIAKNLPANHYDLVVGWSLGGMIARNLLSSSAINAKALVSISSPYQFVKDEHIKAAMPPDIFEQFYNNYENDTKRTTERFHGLVAKGDKNIRFVINSLNHHPDVMNTQQWLPWMNFLRDYSSKDQNYELPPTLIIHGAQDAIVHVEQSYPLAEKLGAEHIIMDNAGHAPHLHDEQVVKSHITQFISKVDNA